MAKDSWLVVAAVVVMAALVGAVLIMQSPPPPIHAQPPPPGLPAPQPPEGPSQQAPPPAAPLVNMSALSAGGLSVGSDTAPVVMVEFSDYQCPFCRNFWLQTYPTLKEKYIDTGEVQLVYKDFPLGFHPAAEMSAEAVACAQEQGKGWALHDKIFEEQAAVGTGTVQYSETDVKGWANSTGLDMTAFDACLDSGKYAQAVNQSLSEGAALGIAGTPSFMIGKRDGSNVVPINGALPYGTFSATIDQLLQ